MTALRYLALLVPLLLLTAPAGAGARMKSVFQCAEKRCTVTKNMGGPPILFELAAHEALKEGIYTTIAGICNSGCVYFASLAKRNVCITPHAKMGIHTARVRRVYEPLFGKQLDLTTEAGRRAYYSPPIGYRVEETYELFDYGNGITEWALAHNKMEFGPGVYVMTYAEALQFWKPCP